MIELVGVSKSYGRNRRPRDRGSGRIRVFCAYVAVGLAIAAFLLVRRDV